MSVWKYSTQLQILINHGCDSLLFLSIVYMF